MTGRGRRSAPGSSRPSSRRSGPTARRSRSCRWPRRPSAIARRGRPRDGRSIGPGHGPDAAGHPGATCSGGPGPRFRPTGRPPSPMRPPSSRPARIPVHAIPGDPMNLKVTVPEDLGPGSGRTRRRARPGSLLDAPAGRSGSGIGRDSHPFGPGDAARARRHRHRRRARACTVIPTATWRFTRWPTRCSAELRPRRPRPALPAGDDAGRHRQRRVARRRRRPAPWGGLRTELGRPDDRRRATAPGRPARRDARRDRGGPSASRGAQVNVEGVDREPRRHGGRRARDVGPGRRGARAARGGVRRCRSRRQSGIRVRRQRLAHRGSTAG